MKRCLVLGGRGFIGSHLVRRLIKEGYMVRVFDRPTVNLENSIEPIRAEIYEGDFNNETDLIDALEGVDFIFHLIGTTLPKTSNDNTIYDMETNVVGTLKLLEFIKNNKNIRFIFISSGGTVYGIPNIIPIPEEHPTNPLCSYGISKLTIEKYLYLYNCLYGLDYAVLRVSNPYGEKQNPKSIQGAVSVFMLKILDDKKIVLWGDGSTIRDFIYIEDVIDAFIKVMDKKIKSRMFNIGSGIGTSLNDLIEAIKFATCKSPQTEYISARQFDVPQNYLDISRARSELDWTPKTTLDVGLKKTWNWLQAQYSHRKK